jgi:hypothetical protein
MVESDSESFRRLCPLEPLRGRRQCDAHRRHSRAHFRTDSERHVSSVGREQRHRSSRAEQTLCDSASRAAPSIRCVPPAARRAPSASEIRTFAQERRRSYEPTSTSVHKHARALFARSSECKVLKSRSAVRAPLKCSTRFDDIDNRSSKLDCRQCLLDRGLPRLARSCGKPPNPSSSRWRRAAAGLRARSAHPGCATASAAVSSVRPPPPSVHRVRRRRPQHGRGRCHEDCRKFEYSECRLRCQLFGRSRGEKQDAFLHQHSARRCGGRRNRYRYRAPALLPIGLGACRTGPGVEAPRRRSEGGGRHGVEVLK